MELITVICLDNYYSQFYHTFTNIKPRILKICDWQDRVWRRISVFRM
jgi:hypothetical protein